MRNLIFAFVLGTGQAEKDALRLARSIRTFGGEFCFNPIWMLSRGTEANLSETTRQELFSLGVRLIGFDMDIDNPSFAFASYVTAASIAEGLAQGETSFMVMMAADTLVLQPPYEFVLPAGKSLGACPVHLKLLGSGYDAPVDGFWELIYRSCRVDMDKIFAMQTTVDEQVVRAYFNAGLLVVRPERGLLRAWKANFEATYQQAEFEAFYRQHELYETFMHQAVLAGTVLSLLKPEEIQQLPFVMNYPLHLHSQISAGRRPADIEQLVTCRFEEYTEFFKSSIHINSALKGWLQAQ